MPADAIERMRDRWNWLMPNVEGKRARAAWVLKRPVDHKCYAAHGAFMSLSGHQSARMKNDEWLTPPEILRRSAPSILTRARQ